MTTQYGDYPVRDEARTHDLRILSRGEFVLIRRPRDHHFGVTARGPFLVQAQEGLMVRLTDLSSGRVLVEARSNCKPISLALGDVATGALGRV